MTGLRQQRGVCAWWERDGANFSGPTVLSGCPVLQQSCFSPHSPAGRGIRAFPKSRLPWTIPTAGALQAGPVEEVFSFL